MPLVSVVLDTNVIVSGLVYPNSVPGRLLGLWRVGSVRLVTSRYLLDEVARVLPRLRQADLTAAEARDLADSFLFLAEAVEPVTINEPRLRDPADAPALGTLLAGPADWLVTGHHDLLILADTYPILTSAAFWDRFGA